MRKAWLRFVLGMVVCLLVLLGTGGVAAAWPDVGPGDLATYGLAEGDLEQISQGYPSGSWMPYADMTRAQFIKMALEAWDVPTAAPETASYADVPRGHQYYGYVEGAAAAGLVTGVGGGRFDLDGSITREQAAAVIARRVAEVKGYDLATYPAPSEIVEILAPFTDEGHVSVSLREELAFAVEQGIVRGNAGVLAPQASLVRIQGAAMLVRSVQQLTADLVITNAKVLTVDDDFSIAEAMAVKDGVISFVGAAGQAARFIGPATEVLDLGGKVIMPGVNDSQCTRDADGLVPPAAPAGSELGLRCDDA